MNANSKRLLSWLCVIAMVLTLAPVMDLSNFAVKTNATPGDANWAESTLGVDGVQAEIDDAATMQQKAADFEAPAEITADGFTAVCPYCGESKTWYTLDAGGDKTIDFDTRAAQTSKPRHLYFTGNVDLTGTTPAKANAAGLLSRGDNGTNGIVCIILDDANITTDLKIEVVSGTVNVFGTGTITSDGSVADRYGDSNLGLFEVTGGTLNLYGGTFIYNNTTAAVNNTGGTVNVYNDAVIGNGTRDTTKLRPSAKIAGTLNMFGGTIRNGVGNASSVGGNVTVDGTGVFNMYGGKIQDGYNNKTNSGRAGNLLVSSGATVNIYGGEIKNGYSAFAGGNIYITNSTTTQFNMYGGKVTGGEAVGSGGNIYAWAAATIHDNALIEDGEAGDIGGNVYIYRRTFTTSGVIRNGTAATSGGNIGINGAQANTALAVSGGMIYDGKLTGGAANSSNIEFALTADKDDCKLEITGGTIVGGVTFDAYDTDDVFKISNNAQIVTSEEIDSETKTAATGVQLPGGDLVDISGLTKDARIAFTAAKDTVLSVARADVLDLVKAGCFSTTDAAYGISANADNQLVVVDAADVPETTVPGTEPEETEPEETVPEKPVAENPGDANLASLSEPEWAQMYKGNNIDNSNDAFAARKTAGTCPICGKNAEWTPLEDGASITAGADAKLHYYFADDADSIAYIYGTASTEASTICLWLNKDITVTGSLRGADKVTFNTFGEGTMTGTGTTCIFDVRNGSALNLYGGKFVSSTATKGVVYLYTGAITANMYDGATIGPDAPVADTAYRNVFMRSGSTNTFNMYGGTIQNGVGTGAGTTATKADGSADTAAYSVSGNLDILSAGNFNMYGGTIKGGTFLSTAANKLGGNIYAHKGADVNIYGGTIENGSAELGGSLYVGTGNRTSNIYGGTIQNSDAVQGGNVYIDLGALLNVSGYALISGGGTKTTVEDEVTWSTTNGGNVFVSKGDGNNGAKLAMTGGTITAGEAQYGGNVYTTASSVSYFDLEGGSVTNGDANKGGNVYSAGPFTMSGASTVISGGTAELGGNVYLTNQTSTMSGGTIENGESVGGGGNVYIASSATFTMTGGTCAHGDTTRSGQTKGSANVLVDGTFNGGEVDTGTVVLKDGYDVWYPTNADALNAYNAQNSQYVTLSGEAVLSGHDVVIDVKGRDVTLTGSGSITLIDTTNADFEGFGNVTIDGNGVVVKDYDATVGDDRYITIKDGNTYSAHYVVMKLTNVVLRTKADGLYYEGQFRCDDTLAGRVTQFGLAVSAGETKPVDLSGKYSYYGAANFEPNAEHTVTAYGVSVFGILKDISTTNRTGKVNADYMVMQVHANPYLKIDLGDEIVTVMACTDSTADKFGSKTLLELVQTINGLWNDDYKAALIAANKQNAVTGMLDFKTRWTDESKMGSEGLAAMVAATGNIV